MRNRIREAIGILARTGWTKETFTDESGRHCLQGALSEAHGLPTGSATCTGMAVSGGLAADLRLVNHVIEEQYPERVGGVGVSRFNDHPDTTLDDVVRVLEKAAIRRDETA